MYKIIGNLKNKKILILGFGREGQSTYKFLRNESKGLRLDIADKRREHEFNTELEFLKDEKNVELRLGNNYLSKLENYDVIIKSPGIPNKLPEIKKAKKKGVKFTSQTQIFLDLVIGKVIGITGTKGKSTTASLIHHILSNSGMKSVLLGNIGKPCLDYLSEDSKDTVFVFELSSHQLSDIKTSPHVAVFLNIFPEHLDYYEDFDDYFTAKTNIAKFQNSGDFFIYNIDDEKIANFAKDVKSKKIGFSLNMKNMKNTLPLKGNPLKGDHNLYTILAAVAAARELKIPDTKIFSAIKTFKPLETRLEEVGTIKGVTFISDSLSTIPQSAVAAAEAFSDKKIVQILGGFDRGIDYEFLGKELSLLDNVIGVVLVGQLADKIELELIKNNYKGTIRNLGNVSMNKIVSEAYRLTPKGGVLLLSPGATSFDMFKDYEDRANKFREAVLNLKR